MLNDKTILITGGTGSLGKRLTEIILSHYKPHKLIIFSRDELKQFEMSKRWNSDRYPSIRYFLGDVRDKDRLVQAFRGVDYVIHAAALKQVPAAEYNPGEFIRTNILGAMNIIDAALETDVEKVVALSTDKACNPINLYGATKLCSDKLFIAANSIHGGNLHKTFSVVRYGNVAGSRGSVIPFFQECAFKGSIPITDPRMTRFWITLDQAAHFVLHILEVGRGGEIFVPKIPSIRITDLAWAIAPECRQEVVGIRPGEKIHELMIGHDDSHNALELERYHILLPQTVFEQRFKEYPSAKRLPPGFEYNSGTNPVFLRPEELRQAIGQLEGVYNASMRTLWSTTAVTTIYE